MDLHIIMEPVDTQRNKIPFKRINVSGPELQQESPENSLVRGFSRIVNAAKTEFSWCENIQIIFVSAEGSFFWYPAFSLRTFQHLASTNLISVLNILLVRRAPCGSC
jgi:hypothetical protein